MAKLLQQLDYADECNVHIYTRKSSRPKKESIINDKFLLSSHIAKPLPSSTTTSSSSFGTRHSTCVQFYATTCKVIWLLLLLLLLPDNRQFSTSGGRNGLHNFIIACVFAESCLDLRMRKTKKKREYLREL